MACPLPLRGRKDGMNEYALEHLRAQGSQLVTLGTVLVQGEHPRHAMDRAALAVNFSPAIAPDVLYLPAQPGDLPRIEQGDILVGGGVTSRVLSFTEPRTPRDYVGHVYTLR